MANTFSMDDRKTWPGQAERAFMKFWKYKLPVPADPVAYIYRAAYSDKEWVAMRYLKEKRPAALNVSTTFDLYWTDDQSGTSRCPHVTFTFPNKMQLPNVGIHISEIPEDAQRVFRTWITSVQRFRSLTKEFKTRCKAVMGNPTGEGDNWITRRIKDLDPRCNTPGQLYHLWPEVQPLMLKKWKRGVQLMATKSRLPKEVGLRVKRENMSVVTGWATPEEFRCEAPGSAAHDLQRFKEINEIILMMSLARDVRDPDYPTFHGPVDID